MTTNFWLNDQLISTDEVPGRLLLDFVRQSLKGTKEGCKEGDCGACTVLIGTLSEQSVDYQPVTSCLVPLGDVQGKHVVTIEGLNLKTLTFVQESMVKFGASQCGYCTPGFIVSMTWFMMTTKDASLDAFRRSISGNLCRCTGYGSILRAGEQIIDKLNENGDLLHQKDRLSYLIKERFLPDYFGKMPKRLQEIESTNFVSKPTKPDVFIAGGTDLYVQRGEQIPSMNVEFLNRIPGLKGYRVEEGMLTVGAMTTFEEFAAIPQIQKLMPKVQDFMRLIASLQIRNRATLGGNIVNASPIGDMTQILLALGSTLCLELNTIERHVSLSDFFLGYKATELKPKELVKEITFPLGTIATRINFEKVSKRRELDIATVCSAARFEVDVDRSIVNATISMGGVSAIPLLLKSTNAFLSGKKISPEILKEADHILQGEIAPISDVRGSKDYKRLLARQLFFAHFTTLFPTIIQFKQLAS